MHIDVYERIWMWMALAIVVLFIGVIGVSNLAYGIHPPSHVETIDPLTVFEDTRFERLGELIEQPDGTLEVRLVSVMFAFLPNEIRVPAGQPIRFRLTATDVTHGFMVAGTNANAMVVPGYITELTMVFDRPGDYLIVCNEFCGTGHHAMYGRVIVEGLQ